MNHTKTILVIDDEPGYRALLECDLTALGYRVHVAAGGPEALTLLESISIDLVITDNARHGIHEQEVDLRGVWEALRLVGCAHRRRVPWGLRGCVVEVIECSSHLS